MPLRPRGTPLESVLTALLSERGLTRKEFAIRIGIGNSTLSRIEHRKPTRLPRKIDISKWAEVLGISEKEKKQLQLAAELSWSPEGVQKLVSSLLKSKNP